MLPLSWKEYHDLWRKHHTQRLECFLSPLIWMSFLICLHFYWTTRALFRKLVFPAWLYWHASFIARVESPPTRVYLCVWSSFAFDYEKKTRLLAKRHSRDLSVIKVMTTSKQLHFTYFWRVNWNSFFAEKFYCFDVQMKSYELHSLK